MSNSAGHRPVAHSCLHEATSVMKSFVDQSGTYEGIPGTVDSPVRDESNMRLLSWTIATAAASR
jgi:hypothetical protein